MLPPLVNQNRCNEISKNDQEFNRLLSERRHFLKHADHKTITKSEKPWMKHLRNEKLRQANEINKNANRIQVEELYKNMKDDTTTSKTRREKKLCDASKLKEHFKALFSMCSEVVDSIEFKDAPSFIRQFQDISNVKLNTTPPDISKKL